MTLTIEEAFYQRTNADATLGNLIDGRLYPGAIPQEVPLPAVAYAQTDYEQWLTHSGPSGLARSVVTVTLAAYEYSSLKAIREVLRDCWTGFAGLIGDTVDSLRIAYARIDNSQDMPIDKIENALGMTVEIVIIYYEGGST